MSIIWQRTDNDGFACVKIVMSDRGYYGKNPGPHELAALEKSDREKGAGSYIFDVEAAQFKVEAVVQNPFDGKPVRVRSEAKPPFGEWTEVH